ncbi:uncharacterized protein [Cherax quadricarinatus]|uniref:uncharacterized protein isoform X2 n=1 Tax=Cherax quadricarinatus TaxID=27406 RepID=UPI002377EB27|nr:uncharacterized protein LOC128686211 isoform X2 [Cherax quadricarinatus]
MLFFPPTSSLVGSSLPLTNLNEESEVPSCVKTYLGSSSRHYSSHRASCHHLPAPRGLCSLVQTLFFSSKPPNCSHQAKVTFCVLESGSISCRSPLQCRNLNHYIGVFNNEVAEIKWQQIKPSNLKRALTSHFQQEGHFGFVFIKCFNTSDLVEDFGQPQYDEDYAHENLESYTQLFLYPRKFTNIVQTYKAKNNNVNINFVMIDSLSRAHFYRSLPRTVRFFEDLYEEVNPAVFDFQFFQALKQRTYESLQGLFSGYVNVTEIPFGTYDVPRYPLPVSQLFGLFKKKGYRTLWLEDLCWNWEWGLIKDLKVINDTLYGQALWENFKKALKHASIDDIDVTLASCDILQSNGKKDPFHNLPAVCFNGRHHHEYVLDYLQLYQASIQNSGQPFLTLTITDVAHDETGLRVQTLDDPLAKYLKFAARLKNTITILFSDHGNTYGKFIQLSPEAHVETFNPFLFMIIPKDVQDILGDVQIRILRDNERRLGSMIDLHNMLLQLIGETSKVADKSFAKRYVTPGGFLTSLSSSRTCNDIPLLHPNLCICKNFEASVEPGQVHMVLADFGLGVLNNQILKQHRKGGGVGFGNCRPLRAAKLRKVRETRVSVELIRYKLDIVVQSVQNESDNRDLFFLTLEAGSKTAALRLISYERMSMYSVYSTCQDDSVELKLCICNIRNRNQNADFLKFLFFGNLIPEFNFFMKNTNFNSNAQMIDFLISPLLGIKPRIDIAYPSHTPCLFTVIHKYKSGIVLLAANFCSTFYELDVVMESDNLNLSCPEHSKFLLHSSDVKLLFAGTVANPKVAWQWSHDIKIKSRIEG